VFFWHVFVEKLFFLFRTYNHTHFVNFYMAQQNINFDKLLTKDVHWGPPQIFFYTVQQRNFEVALIKTSLSEANQK
jgi:hypothetical protein